jgi:class I fructose-bisphosphate aldolase
MMRAMELKLNRLFNADSKNSVIIAMDHGFYMGNVKGLEDPRAIAGRLIKNRVEGVLLGFGMGKVTADLFSPKESPSRILAMDHALMYSIPGQQTGVLEHCMFSTVDQALRWGFDAVKVLLVFGLERDRQRQSFLNLGKLVSECDRMSMPIMIEPVPWGSQIPEGMASDPDLIAHMCRIAMECGADVLKVPYTGDTKTFGKICKESAVPILVLGGPKTDSVEALLHMVRDVIDAGARGVVFGRNIWGYGRMESLIEALNDIVHRGSTVSSVVKKYALSAGKKSKQKKSLK